MLMFVELPEASPLYLPRVRQQFAVQESSSGIGWLQRCGGRCRFWFAVMSHLAVAQRFCLLEMFCVAFISSKDCLFGADASAPRRHFTLGYPQLGPDQLRHSRITGFHQVPLSSSNLCSSEPPSLPVRFAFIRFHPRPDVS